MNPNDTEPVDNLGKTEKGILKDFTSNELRALSGVAVVILMVGILIVKDTSKIYDSILTLLAGFFVGGAMLTSLTPKE